MIKTKRVKLTPKEFFNILIIRYIKRRWWLIVWIWGLALIISFKEDYESFDYFFFGMAIIYPIILIWQFWRYVNSKDNKILLLERHYEIDSDKINGIIDEETYSPIKLDHFIKVDLIRNTYLLYVAKNQFIYIPIDSFETEIDKKWFKEEIIEKIKK